MKKLLNQKEQHIAYKREEAEEIVEKAKENAALTMFKINEKYNKHGQYFLVDLTYTFNTPKEVMESNPRENNAPDGQMNMDEVQAPEELPKFEDPFADVEVKKDVTDEDVPF
ncbi:hypothetical protein ACIQYL_10085 [Lysinibacillus xylanilyticus]|uniref:hypothetical protein n=1 Tax=Lysinibacillus xylanilyticus TaxID=582475 RepID=UPI00380882D0